MKDKMTAVNNLVALRHILTGLGTAAGDSGRTRESELLDSMVNLLDDTVSHIKESCDEE